jgi:hypothetical protein
VRRGPIFLAVLSASLCTGVAGATSGSFIVGRSTVTALAADGDQAAFAAARTATDCDRTFIWQRLPRQLFQLGKQQRCAPLSRAPIATVAVTGGRALWLTSAGGRIVDWQLWTATTTRRTPRQLQVATRDMRDVDVRPPIVVGSAGGGLLPYAVDSTVTTLRANGSTAFSWTASSPVVALAAADGRVAVVEEGARVTVLDASGKIVSVDLYASDVSAVAFAAKGLLVQRGVVLELRRGAAASEYVIAPDAPLEDANGNWSVWSDGKLVHVLHLPDGAQKATFAGSLAAFVGNRLYVANGRTITIRTIH